MVVLDQATQWMNMAQTVLEALLLCRVLSLRLFRPYTFITLYCLLSVLFDGVCWWAGWTTQAAQQAVAVQTYFFALLTPLAAWEVFEEMLPQAGKWRRMEVGRLISGMLLTLVFAVIILANVDVRDEHGNSVAIALAGILCWAGNASASLAFLWFTCRSLRRQKIIFLRNTVVWAAFFMVTNFVTVVYCLVSLTAPVIGKPASESGVLVLQLLNAGILLWCTYKLRRTGAVVSAVSAKEEEQE